MIAGTIEVPVHIEWQESNTTYLIALDTRSGQVLYWSGITSWTVNMFEAVRFARYGDAERVIKSMGAGMKPMRVVEFRGGIA